MLKNLQLTNFRGFEQLELKQLNRVNLIVGDNNTGKTSILEALFLLLAQVHKLGGFPAAFRAYEPRRAGGGAFRGPKKKQNDEEVDGDSFEQVWTWLFRNQTISNSISIDAVADDGSVRQMAIKDHPPEPGVLARAFRRDPAANGEVFRINADASMSFFAVNDPSIRVSRLSVRPTSPIEDAEKFNQAVILSGGEEAAEAFMRVVCPNLLKLRYRKLKTENDPIVRAELDNLPVQIPSSQLGQAFTRLLHIYCELMTKKSGVLLADEIENGVYYGNLLPFWKGIIELARSQQSQIFATTHSFECMKAAHQAACERADKGGTYDLNIIRLDRVDWGIKATEFGRETMEVAIANGWEMR